MNIVVKWQYSIRQVLFVIGVVGVSLFLWRSYTRTDRAIASLERFGALVRNESVLFGILNITEDHHTVWSVQITRSLTGAEFEMLREWLACFSELDLVLLSPHISREVIEQLPALSNLNVIAVAEAELNGKDIELLSRIGSLRAVLLGNVSVQDAKDLHGLSKLENLEVLSLSGPSLSKEDVRKLIRQLPNIRVVTVNDVSVPTDAS